VFIPVSAATETLEMTCRITLFIVLPALLSVGGRAASPAVMIGIMDSPRPRFRIARLSSMKCRGVSTFICASW